MSEFTFILPTTELEAVNVILSGIGEAPVNSLDELTADVSVAHAVLAEVSKDVQLAGWQWNMEDDYPLKADEQGLINVSPSVIRVAFSEPCETDLTMRGTKVYDRKRHSYTFPKGTTFRVRVTLLLPFSELPETARRYITIRALRIYQARVVGSQTLNTFTEYDEARARCAMLAEERQQDKPNMLTGTQAATSVWKPATALLKRRSGGW